MKANGGMKSFSIYKQVFDDMYYNEGIKSFYWGFIPSMGMSSYGFIMMYSYEVISYLCGYTSGLQK